MIFHLGLTAFALLVSLTSYPSFAMGANSFRAKKVIAGENILVILKRNGFTAREREAALASSPSIHRLLLTTDAHYLVKRGPTETEVRFYDAQTMKGLRIIKNHRGTRAFSFYPQFQRKVVQVEGRTSGNLIGGVLAKIKSNWVASRFADAYVFELKSGRRLGRNARFSLTVEKLHDEGQFIMYGEVIRTTLDFMGTKITKRLIQHKSAGVFVSQGDLLEEKPFFAPVEYLKFASLYSPHRMHPITKRLQPHLGIDFELPEGDPVFAPKAGTVLRYGHNRAAGFFIVLQHGNGFQSFYNHLSRIDRRIKQGLRVRAGEKIAEIGCTGYCTGPHLHFAIKKNGVMIDPIGYIRSYPYHMDRLLRTYIAKN